MSTLKNNIGKEVYIASTTPEFSAVLPMMITQSSRSFKYILNNTDIDLQEGLIAVHGILTSAISIPNKLNSDIEIFIVLQHSNIDNEDYLIEIPSLYILEKVIEIMISNTVLTNLNIEEDIMDNLFSLDVQEIEDIYILYGYKLALTFNYIKSLENNDIIENSKKLFNVIKEYQV